MKNPIRFLLLTLVILLGVSGCGLLKNSGQPTNQQPTVNTPAATPSITVGNQNIVNNSVVIESVTAIGPSWLAIHQDNNGNPGDIIGQAPVNDGVTSKLVVPIDVTKVTERLFAMLHTDDGTIGSFEFPSADAPIKIDDQIVLQSFTVTNISDLTTENNAVIINLTAKNWQFIPDTIQVKQGDNVELQIHSVDVTHGFSIAEYDIKADIKPNETTTVKFTADKKGTFSFFCSVFCGEGHRDMKGSLIVE